MSHIVREQQQATHQSFAFLDVSEVMILANGNGVIAKILIGITKALTVHGLTSTPLSVSHVQEIW